MDCLQLGAMRERGKRGVRGAGDCPAKLSKKERCARAEQRKETEVALRPLGNGTRGQRDKGKRGRREDGTTVGQVLLFGQLQFELLLEVSCVHCVYSYACLMFHVLGTLSLATALGGVPDKLACDVATLPQFNGRIN